MKRLVTILMVVSISVSISSARGEFRDKERSGKKNSHSVSTGGPKLVLKNSDRRWVNRWFDACVVLLQRSAKVLGITYYEINVYIFCIALPAVLTGLAGIFLYQRRVIGRLKKELVQDVRK